MSIPSAAHISQPTPPYLSTFLPYTLSYSFSFHFPDLVSLSSLSLLFSFSSEGEEHHPRLGASPARSAAVEATVPPPEFFSSSFREFRRVLSLVSTPFYLAYMTSLFSFLFYFLYSSMVLLSFLHHELQHEQDKERGQRRYNGISEHRGGGGLLRTSSVFFLSFKKTFFVLNPGIFSNPGVLLVFYFPLQFHMTL